MKTWKQVSRRVRARRSPFTQKNAKIINSFFNSKLPKLQKGKRHCAFNVFNYDNEQVYFVFRKIDPRGSYKEDLIFQNNGKIYFDKI